MTVATHPGGGPKARPARGEPDRGAVVDGVTREPPRTARGTARNAEPPARETPGDPPIVADHAVPRLRSPPPAPRSSSLTLYACFPSPVSAEGLAFAVPKPTRPLLAASALSRSHLLRQCWAASVDRPLRTRFETAKQLAGTRGREATAGGPRRTGRPPADGPCAPRTDPALPVERWLSSHPRKGKQVTASATSMSLCSVAPCVPGPSPLAGRFRHRAGDGGWGVESGP